MKRLPSLLCAALLVHLFFFSFQSRAQGVGIGTTTPTARLEVNGDFKVGTAAGSAAMQISQPNSSQELSNDTFGQSFTLPTAGTINSITIYTQNRGTSGSGYLRIYSGSGFGTYLMAQPVPPPSLAAGESAFTVSLSSPLAVPAGTYTFYFIFLGTATNHMVLGSNAYAGGTYFGSNGAVASQDLKFQLNYTTTHGNSLALYAATTGNVGVGTNAPTQKLEVDGNVLVSGSGNGVMFPDGTKQTTRALTGVAVSGPLSGAGTAASPLTVATAGSGQAGVLSAADYAAFSDKFTLPSLNAGSVLFSNGSTVAQNNGKLFWDNANGRLGVGTSTPATSLAVSGDFSVGNIGGTTDQISQPVRETGTSAYRVGQSFTMPTAGTLTSVAFRPYANAALTGTLFIYAGDGPGGTLLHSQGFLLAANNVDEFTLTLSAPVAVSAAVYTFVFELNGACPFLLSSTNPYAGGKVWQDGFAYTSRDLSFTVRYSVGAGAQALYASSSGMVGIGTASPAFKLDVNGAIRCVGAVNTTSDARLKQRVRPIGDALARVQALRGVRYTFRQADFPALNLPAGEQIGLLAQEVETVFPELVSTDAQGYKAVNYAQLTPVLIEALKEQQRRLEQQREQLDDLRRQQAALQHDHADLQTLKQQLARLLPQPAPTAQAR